MLKQYYFDVILHMCFYIREDLIPYVGYVVNMMNCAFYNHELMIQLVMACNLVVKLKAMNFHKGTY